MDREKGCATPRHHRAPAYNGGLLREAALSDIRIRPEALAVVRAPLLPFDALEALGDALEAPKCGGGPAELERALAADRRRVGEALWRWVEVPEVREALWLASPSLDERLRAGDRSWSVTRALIRYLGRMAGRPTPFGLFAGYALAEVGGGRTELRVGPRRASRRRTRLDARALEGVVAALAGEPGLPCVANPTAWRAPGGRLRYLEPGGRQLVEVDATPELLGVLEAARAGATLGSLAEGLARSAAVPRAEAEAYLRELVEAGLLQCGPACTGEDPLDPLIAVAPRLEPVRRALRALDAGGIGAGPASSAAAGELLGPEAPPPLQVDLERAFESARVGDEVIARLERAVAALHRITPPPRDPLAEFARRFEARYGEAEVPLLEALDPDHGLGLEEGSDGSPALAALALPPPARPAAAPSARDAWLAERVARCGRELRLSEADLRALEIPAEERPPLPDAGSALLVVAADGEVCLSGLQGPGGAVLLGRFCGGDARLRAGVERHLRAEEARDPDAVFAEVVHLPPGEAGNVAFRPALRPFEIWCGGRGAAGGRELLALDDLWISVRGGRLELRSGRLGRTVRPRLSAAHDFALSSFTPYRFLGLLQHHGRTIGLRWRWGALETAPFLPRVVLDGVTLSLARWRLEARELESIARAGGAGRYQAVQALRARLGLPRWVALKEHDQLLPVDLDQVLSVESLVDAVRGRREATLQEPFRPDALLARGEEGRFIHEMVIPFLVEQPSRARAEPPRPAGPVRRVPAEDLQPSGSPLYLKLYAGEGLLDGLLREVVQPAVERGAASGAVPSWHFLRYHDGEWHLRLRLFGPPERLEREAWPDLREALAPWRADRRVFRLEAGRYEPELERYGGPEGIGPSEALFHADSVASVALVEAAGGDLDARWRLALLGCHALLEDFGVPAELRIELLAQARDFQLREHQGEAALIHGLGRVFREERAALEEALFGAGPPDGVREALALRSRRVREIRESLERAALSRPLRAILPAYLHLHVNRVVRSHATTHELLICELLGRLYRSRRARQAGRG